MTTKSQHAAMALTTALVLSTALMPSAHAQRMYRCTNAAGVQHWSDRPCTNDTLGVRTAPADTPNNSGNHRYRAPTYVPTPTPTSEHLKYLSPACSQISEAMRTAPSRGVRGAELGQLQMEYQRKCRDEDSSARQRVYEDERNQQEQKLAVKRERELQQEQTEQSREQCGELKRILYKRRESVASMNAGEKADLQRFEASYTERCVTAGR
jgi:Domain of unknown function (DUF4124)